MKTDLTPAQQIAYLRRIRELISSLDEGTVVRMSLGETPGFARGWDRASFKLQAMIDVLINELEKKL